jgi:hypothetical protein
MNVSERFTELLSNLALTSDQRSDGVTKHHGVRKCLNAHYHNSSSETANSMLIGSWGKSTEIRPPRDIDVLFVLPDSVFLRYQSRPGNKQSQLLQEVKDVLRATYPNTKMRADGQVVVVPFTTYAVEVIPAFTLTTGQYWICDSNGGGQYKITDPEAEKRNIAASNDATNGNTRHLVRMLKRWQEYCTVPLRSFCIELLAVEFLSTWEHRGKGTFYYDWITRDFFKWLCGQVWGTVVVPGTYEAINIGKEWESKAESAHGRAVKACQYESEKLPYSAGTEWQQASK